MPKNQIILSRVRMYGMGIEGRLDVAKKALANYDIKASVGNLSSQEQNVHSGLYWRTKIYKEMLDGYYKAFPEINQVVISNPN